MSNQISAQSALIGVLFIAVAGLSAATVQLYMRSPGSSAGGIGGGLSQCNATASALYQFACTGQLPGHYDFLVSWAASSSQIIAQDPTTKVVNSSSDIGGLLNGLLANSCPKFKNPASGRTVPDCVIDFAEDTRPGFLNGTTTIKYYDDWFVRFYGEAPSPLSLQNVNTIYAATIDIESTSGIIQCLKNGVVADGGGTFDVENLALRTKTIISAPAGGGTTGADFQCGTATNNIAYSRIFTYHVGVKDDSGQNGCFMFYTTGADDLTQTNDLFCSGTTFHTLVYINAWDYLGIGSIQISATATSATTNVDSYAFAAVAQGSFQLDSLTLAGTYNGIFEIAGNAAACFTTGCVARFNFLNFGAAAALNTYSGPQTGYRVYVNAPTWINQYTVSGGGNAIDMFSNSTAQPGIFYDLQIGHSTTAKNYQLLSNPFGTFTLNQFGANNNYAMGPYYTMGSAGAASPTCGRQYTELGERVYNFTSSGGSGVSINIKDDTGTYTLVTGAATLTAIRVPIGSIVTFTCSSAPTVKVYVENF